MALGKKAFGDTCEPVACPPSSAELHGMKALEATGPWPIELLAVISESAA